LKDSNVSQRHTAFVGAGPGGLTAARMLAARGCKVAIFRKELHMAGRNAAIVQNGCKFDPGRTFLMRNFMLDEVFKEAGRHIDNSQKCVKLEPATARGAMLQQLDPQFPGSRDGCGKDVRCSVPFGFPVHALLARRDFREIVTIHPQELKRRFPSRP
jgi:NAD(P)-binding Rossmann-like domain